MAQRLATDYVKACLKLTEAEMSKFVQLSKEYLLSVHVKVFDNGNQEMSLHDGKEEVILPFEYRLGHYVFEGSFRLNQPKMVNFMRKLVASFRGDAIVKRIYSSFTMVYRYKQGKVTQIMEVTDRHQKIIYQFKDTVGQLEQLFSRTDVETEIHSTQIEINEMLDKRNESPSRQDRFIIDQKLTRLARKLFILEA